MNRFVIVLLSAFSFLLVSTKPAYAYLDPGSGSIMLQILLGGMGALLVILKLYWHRFLDLLGIDKEKKTNTETEDLLPKSEPKIDDGRNRQE
jgi:hypothetical protein